MPTSRFPDNAPSEVQVGQAKCQGGAGHSWDDVGPPIGYEPKHWVEVHLRCTRCRSRTVVYVDRTGHRGRGAYKRDPDWVKFPSGTAPTQEEKTLAFIATLDPDHVLRSASNTNGKADKTNKTDTVKKPPTNRRRNR